MDGMQVSFRLKGLSAEKLMNEARKRGIVLLRIKRRPGRSLTACCARKDYGALRKLSEEKGYEISAPAPVGLLRRVMHLRRRWGIALGAAVGAALLMYALGFIWQIQILGAGPYEGEVQAFLRERGVHAGIRREQVDWAALRDALEWRLPAVQRVRLDAAGIVVRVLVDQGVPPPAIETAGDAGDVVADRDALVLSVVTYAGTAQVKPGDFVRAGQTLILGQEAAGAGGTIPVKARGSVTGRVWETARVRVPLTETATIPTGRIAVCRALTGPLFAWRYEEPPDYLTADVEITRLPLGGAWLPVTLVKESYREAALEKIMRNQEEVAREAEQIALRRLSEMLKNAETVDKWINFRMIEGDHMVVEAAAELWTEIGRFRKNVP